MTPNQLADELGIEGKTLRSWLRATYPRPPSEKWGAWDLSPEQVRAARERWAGGSAKVVRARVAPASPGTRNESDEAYVIDRCDEVLGEAARRQYRFDWLRGDAGTHLPVDAYYPNAELVVEYRERQHDEPVAFFDKPGRMTVSGVNRGEQRRRYDERREELIPANGLRLVIIRSSDLDADPRGRLRRNVEANEAVARLVTMFAKPKESGAEGRESEGVAVHAVYSGTRVDAVFDPSTSAVKITSGPLDGQHFKSPTGAARAVVCELRPEVSPHRNGWSFWLINDTRVMLQSIRPR